MKNIFLVALIIVIANCVTLAQLTPPFLISPPAESVQSSQPVLFQWTPTSGATKYWIQISTNPGFSIIFFENQNILFPIYSLSGFQNGAVYYWRIKAGNNTIWSDWSFVNHFTYNTSMLQSPYLVAPANGSNHTLEPIQFTWNISTGATKYCLQVASNNTFTNFLYNDSNLTNTYKQISGFENGSTYYWRVKAGNNTEWSLWSSTWEITYNRTTLPDPVTLISPITGSNQTSEPILLLWLKSNGAERYWIQVAGDMNFTSLFRNDSNYSNTSIFIYGLRPGNTYYWRVKSKNNIGWNDWSSVWNFQYKGPPYSPVMLIPTHNSNQTTQPIIFNWDSSNTATQYWLQVSANSSFNNFIHNDSNVSSISASISGFLDGTVYYWRVKARNSAGWSSWSAVWNFSYNVNTVPNNVNLILPSNSSTQYLIFMRMVWNSSNTATKYWIQLGEDSLFNNLIYENTNLSDTSVSLVAFVCGASYYWRVKAGNSIGWSEWSATWNFKYGFIVPTPLTPLKDSSQRAEAVNFSWFTGLGGATNFWIQISNDSNFVNLFYNDSSLTNEYVSLSGFQNGLKYYWRVRAIYTTGISDWSSVFNFRYLIPVSVRLLQDIPYRFMLNNNYPNPFNPTTIIKYGLQHSAHVTLSIYNTLGQCVSVMVNDKKEAGYYEQIFNGENLPSGIYFYRLVAAPSNGGEPYIETRKMLLLK